MSMKRLIESLGKTKMATYARKSSDDVTVGDTKSKDGAPRGPFRYLHGTGVQSISHDAAHYLLSRLNNNSGQILDEEKFRQEFVYGAYKLIWDNLDDIVEKSLKASNGGKTSPL
jgi:hypothetical protein